MRSADWRNGESALRAAMIDAYGRHPLCAHKALGRPLPDYLVHRGGVPWDVVEVLECRDVHLLAQSIARAQYLADADGILLDLDRPAAAPLRYTRGSLWLAYVLGGLTLFTLVGFCGFLAKVIL